MRTKPLAFFAAPALLFLLFHPSPGAVFAEDVDKPQAKRQKIDQMASEALQRLNADNSAAKGLFDGAYGYAVFSNIKVSLGVTGGGGTGVAVVKGTGNRTYMKMGTAGLNLGLGGQKYQVVFLFENKTVFNNFVEKGWEAEASANAVAGKSGANAEATFRNGMAVYQLTDAGLMLQADIAGTKYWKSKKLN